MLATSIELKHRAGSTIQSYALIATTCFLWIAGITGVGKAAAQTAPLAAPLTVSEIAGTYALIEFQGDPMPGDHRLTIHDDATIWGHDGCNSGRAGLSADLSHWQPNRFFITTKRLCRDEGRAGTEVRFFAFLSGTYDWALIDGDLYLYEPGNEWPSYGSFCCDTP